MILMYAVVRADADVPTANGVTGRRLELVRGPDVAVVVEECSRLPAADPSSALRFARVLNEINRSAPVLPVRFPTALRNRSDVRSELRRRAVSWRQRLEELDGLVEVVLRASRADGLAPVAAERESGGAYLRRRAAVVRAYEDLVTQLQETVEPWCRDVRRLPSTRDARLTCLLPREDVPKLRLALDGWQERTEDREVRVSGPMPAFSFVGDPGSR